MKFRVNLLPQELKPQITLFTVSFVLTMWAVAGVALFLTGLNYQQAYKDTEIRTKDIQTQHSSKTSMLKALTTARDNRVQDPALLSRVESLQNEVRSKQLLLRELKGREQLKNQGFATLMMDLAEHHQNSLWLTRIKINDKKIRMEGGVVDSASVPKWISKLRQSDYFSGRNFAGTRMYRNDEDELSFIISSDLTEMALEEEARVETQ